MDAPLLGRSLILLSLLVSVAGAMVAFTAGLRPSVSGWTWSRRFAYAYAALMALANGVMIRALVAHDFSVGYVAQVGSRSVPDWVSVVSLWSSLEGSILFWGLVLGVYVSVATWAHRKGHEAYMPWAVGVWLATGAFFSFLLAGPAQPFHTMTPPPPDGPGPNPLLQNHLLMVVHPPCLYLGYVGMTIPFGLASAALLTGRLGHDFLRPLRTWLLVPWTFLTMAIVLGGWWAYEVLGWGGYWAWDPVENASFLPWLTATAALHSALLMERKAALKGWTVTLIQGTFLLTILGTFMTRSGVFNSVHSFSQSSIGPTILVFLAGALLFSIVLLATRIDRLASEQALEPGLSREAAFLVNNLLFVLFTFTVLIGTVFPLVVEATRGVQMSVGRPYFDRMAVPIGVTLLLLLGVGPALPWGRATGEQTRRALLPPLIGGFACLALGLVFGVRNAWTLVTLAFAGYAGQVTLAELWRPVAQRRLTAGVPLGGAVLDLLRRSRRRTAGYVVGQELRGEPEGRRVDLARGLHADLRRGPDDRGAPPRVDDRELRRDARRPRDRAARALDEPVLHAAPADRHAGRADPLLRGPLPLDREHRRPQPGGGDAGAGEPHGGLDLDRDRHHGRGRPAGRLAGATAQRGAGGARSGAGRRGGGGRAVNRTVVLAGAALALPLVGVLYANLGHDPHSVDSPLIGKPAPEFALPAVDGGQVVRLSDQRGRVVVVNFWATWCLPCLQEHQVLTDGARRYGDAVFLGVIYQDEDQRVRQFGVERGAAYPSLTDELGKTAIAYGVYGVPETFFISPDGVIVDKYVGPLTHGALQERVAEARRAASPGAP